MRKTALTIAGSDSSGGAGIQADIKTMMANGVYAMSAVTALTAQNTTGVTAIMEVTPEFLGQQLDCVFTDIRPDAVKIGMVSSEGLIRKIAEKLKEYKAENVVVDPVMGDYGKLYSSYTDELCQEMKRLIPYANVLTPNLTEACRILDLDYHSVDFSEPSLEQITQALSEKGPDKIVITGLQQGNQIFNYVFEKNKTSKLIATRKIGGDRSGTGDVFSSIVTGALLQGDDFEKAVRRAIEFLDKAIEFTVRQDLPWNYGICFEEYLKEL